MIRGFGPKYMGGKGDTGARINPETAGTGLSGNEIDPSKVSACFCIMSVDGLADVVFKEIWSYRRKISPSSWPSRNV